MARIKSTRSELVAYNKKLDWSQFKPEPGAQWLARRKDHEAKLLAAGVSLHDICETPTVEIDRAVAELEYPTCF